MSAVTDEDQSAPEPPRPLQAAACLVSAALGFVLVATIGYRATPWPEDFDVTVKLPYLEQHAGEFDALYLGSSEVLRSFVPHTIDARLKKHGIDQRSFNLSGASMFSFESDYVLRKALAIEGLQLEHIYLQPGSFDPRPNTPSELANMLSDRSVFWHDSRQLLNVLTSLVSVDTPLPRKLNLARRHAHAWAWRLCSYGQGSRILRNLFGFELWDYQPISTHEVAKGSGYKPLEELRHPAMKARRHLLLDDLDGYQRKIDAIALANAAPLPPDAYCRLKLLEQSELIRASGAEPIYVIPPSSVGAHHALRMAEEGALRLIAFNNPARHRRLYSAEMHFDPNHLSRDGAELFSTLFAEELARVLQTELDR